MSPSPRLFRPRSVLEATGLLQHYGEDALAVAGGTAVSLMLYHGLVAPVALVSIGGVGGLGGITVSDSTMTIGAGVTHHAVATNPEVVRALPVLAEAFGVVGNHRVRAAATVGGVLAEGDHASDPPAVLRVLDAVARVVGSGGERRIPVADLLVDHYETSLLSDELIVGVDVPLLPPGTGATYTKFRSTAHEDRPCVGVAAVVRLDGAGRCEELRVCVGAACAVPLRCGDVERAARGSVLDAAGIERVADAYAEAVRPVADLRGSEWYRREMVRVHVARAVQHCVNAERGETR